MAGDDAGRDANRVPTLLLLSNANDGAEVAAWADPATHRLLVNSVISGAISTKTALTASSPTFATVGVTSAEAVASNANRKGLVLTNTSNNYISLGIGVAAVLYSGITLTPFGTWTMDEYTYTTGQIRAIASAASSNLGVQEWA